MPNQPNVIGVDLGGTKIHIGKYSLDYQLITEERVPTNSERGLKKVLNHIKELIIQLADSKTLAAGIGFPGFVDPRKNILHLTPNIPGEQELNLNKIFEHKLDFPCYFDNDANLFTYAESEINYQNQDKTIIGLTLGTGLGGGIVIDGQIFHGSNGFAAEFGHLYWSQGQEWESHLSGKADKTQLGQSLGRALSDLIFVFNPDVFVLGGGVTDEFQKYKCLDQAWEIIKKRNLEKSYENLEVSLSTLYAPGTLGAAILAHNKSKNA